MPKINRSLLIIAKLKATNEEKKDYWHRIYPTFKVGLEETYDFLFASWVGKVKERLQKK